MESQLKDELCCPICTDLFVSPLRLPCGHSYCRACLKAMLKVPTPEPRGRLERLVYDDEDEERVKLSCPECRREYLMNDQGLDRFQSDFKLAKLVELFRRLEMTSLTSDSELEEPSGNNSNEASNRDSVLSVDSTRSEARVSVTETQVCEVLSNVPTALCADTLVKQVETGIIEEDVLENQESTAGHSSGGACGGAIPVVTATATVMDAVPEFQDNYFANIVNGESGEIEMFKSVETGEFEKCKSFNRCQAAGVQTLQNLHPNQGSPPHLFSGPYDNLGATASANIENTSSHETQTSNFQSEHLSRHGSESPKFPSGNYDNVIEEQTVVELLASASDGTNPSCENPQSNVGSTNANPSNNSSLSLTSSNSRSSKSTSGSKDNKHLKGAAALASHKVSSSESKAGVSDSSDYDDDMRMASSVVVKKRRKKKKKNRVASFFSSLLFSSSSSSEEENLDSEDERKQEQRRKDARHYLYPTTSSSD